MATKNLPIKYFINVIVIQNSVLTMMFGWNIPFMYPNYECTTFGFFNVHEKGLTKHKKQVSLTKM
jgi:hypothetical protein